MDIATASYEEGEAAGSLKYEITIREAQHFRMAQYVKDIGAIVQMLHLGADTRALDAVIRSVA